MKLQKNRKNSDHIHNTVYSVCVCVFMLFHLLVFYGCTTSVIYVRSSDQRSYVVNIF